MNKTYTRGYSRSTVHSICAGKSSSCIPCICRTFFSFICYVIFPLWARPSSTYGVDLCGCSPVLLSHSLYLSHSISKVFSCPKESVTTNKSIHSAFRLVTIQNISYKQLRVIAKRRKNRECERESEGKGNREL